MLGTDPAAERTWPKEVWEEAWNRAREKIDEQPGDFPEAQLQILTIVSIDLAHGREGRPPGHRRRHGGARHVGRRPRCPGRIIRSPPECRRRLIAARAVFSKPSSLGDDADQLSLPHHVAALAVLGQIQAQVFVFGADAQANKPVQQPEQHQCHHDGVNRDGSHRDGLGEE